MLDNITRLFLYKIRLYENINGVVVVFELLREIERVKQRARVIQFIFLLFCIEKCVNIARSFVFNDKGVFFIQVHIPPGCLKYSQLLGKFTDGYVGS